MSKATKSATTGALADTVPSPRLTLAEVLAEMRRGDICKKCEIALERCAHGRHCLGLEAAIDAWNSKYHAGRSYTTMRRAAIKAYNKLAGTAYTMMVEIGMTDRGRVYGVF